MTVPHVGGRARAEDQIPDLEARCIALYGDGKTPDQIADMLGVSDVTVRARLEREQLRRMQAMLDAGKNPVEIQKALRIHTPKLMRFMKTLKNSR